MPNFIKLRSFAAIGAFMGSPSEEGWEKWTSSYRIGRALPPVGNAGLVSRFARSFSAGTPQGPCQQWPPNTHTVVTEVSRCPPLHGSCPKTYAPYATA